MILIAYNLPLIFADDFDNLLNILDAALGRARATQSKLMARKINDSCRRVTFL